MVQRRQPQVSEKAVWWYQVKLWSVAVISIALLSACFIVNCVEKYWGCCPKKWKSFRSNCYFISTENKNWWESEENCLKMKAHLLVINTKEEQDFIVRDLDNNLAYYMGLSDPEGKRAWQWVDQTPYNESAAFWHQGEPSDPNEHCVILNAPLRSAWGWHDVRCEVSQASICKMVKIHL